MTAIPIPISVRVRLQRLCSRVVLIDESSLGCPDLVIESGEPLVMVVVTALFCWPSVATGTLSGVVLLVDIFTSLPCDIGV